MSGITVIILAAGSASRMKTAKQVLAFENTTLLGKVITQAQASAADDVIVILGAFAEKIKERIAGYKITIIENKRWETGLGSSIAAGIKHLRRQKKDPMGILIMLADQPLIDTAYLNRMIDLFMKNNRIVATKYTKNYGVPAVFPPSCFEKLATLDQDFGARHILNDPESEVIALDAGDKTMDIDTPEDYEAVVSISGLKSRKA